MKHFPSLALRTFLLASLLAFNSRALAESDAPLSRANQTYAAGKFQDAINEYETMVQSGDWSASLFYDLGNAFYRAKDSGRAILNYERALALEPDHPETKANLRIVRDEARALELVPSWSHWFLRFATLNQLTEGATLLFWISLFLGVAFVFSQRRRAMLIALAACSLIAAGLLSYVIFAVESGSEGHSLAIVIDNNVQARLATADTASSVLVLPAGSEIKVKRQRGDWVYAVLPNNLQGWIPAKSVEAVRL